MRFNSSFIGHTSLTEEYKQNILYKYNSYGHRCNEINDINQDNYILFSGCSHTEGVGVSLQDTFAYKTAQTLETDYYNLGISASGIDVLFYNLMIWLNTYKKPKLIVIQYPDESRFAIKHPERPFITPIGSWTNIESLSSLFVEADKHKLIYFRNLCSLNILNLFLENLKVPVIKLNYFGTQELEKDSIRVRKLDWAVDDIHYGPETHLNVADIICDKYQNAVFNNTGTI